MVIRGEITPNLRSLDSELARKEATHALTILLEWSWGKLENEIWVDLVCAVIRMMEQNVNVRSGTVYTGNYIDLPEENTMQMSREGYQKVFSCDLEPVDRLASIENIRKFFLEKMNGLHI
jgi:hypothetical protein